MRCRAILAAAASLVLIAGQQASAAEPADHRVARNLKRPLFSITRRPPAAASVAPHSPASPSLPRLIGIVVYDGHREALFAAAATGRPLTAQEGGRIGAYTIRRIEPRQVTVSGPEGARTLRTSFTATLPSAPAPLTAPEPGFAP